MKRTLVIAVAVLAIATFAIAQKKPLSPPAKAEGQIAGKSVTIDYSAPSMREREIFGGLVPYDTVWRTGANAATTLMTETDLMIGDLSVPAGTYTIFTIPAKNEWTLIVSKETGQWGTRYNDSKDLGRTKMSVESVDEAVETFVIAIEGDALTMTWANTRASVAVKAK